MDAQRRHLLLSATFSSGRQRISLCRLWVFARELFGMRRTRKHSWLVGLLTIALSGCATYQRYRPTFWPFPERKLTSFHTPAMRVDAIHEYAMHSTGVDSPEQRQLTDQLARQIQVEPDPLVRQAVVTAIADFSTPMAQQVLEAGLSDENAAVRVACCRALGKRAEAVSVACLGNALRSDKDIDVRLAATAALGKIKSPEATKALAAALDDRDPALQYAGVQSLKAITGRDYGPDVQAWRQVAAGGNPPPYTPSVAERLRKVSPF
jgi:hypothetical protein